MLTHVTAPFSVLCQLSVTRVYGRRWRLPLAHHLILEWAGAGGQGEELRRAHEVHNLLDQTPVNPHATLLTWYHSEAGPYHPPSVCMNVCLSPEAGLRPFDLSANLSIKEASPSARSLSTVASVPKELVLPTIVVMAILSGWSRPYLLDNLRCGHGELAKAAGRLLGEGRLQELAVRAEIACTIAGGGRAQGGLNDA
jgi:hypothetical protein